MIHGGDEEGGSIPRRLIATLEESPEDEDVVLAGRVLRRVASGKPFALADDSGTVDVVTEYLGADSHEPFAGDIVEVRGRVEGGMLRAASVRLLTPYRRDVPFPSPGGEYYRLHAGGARRVELLRLRAKCLAAIRSFFARRDFVEVQTPCRVRAPGLEPHLRAEPSGSRFLITSPEYHMKRLLAGGLGRIYSMGPCWRGDEHGPQHLGEFCMLEWYRAYCSLDELMAETEQLLAEVAREVIGSAEITWQGAPLSLEPPFLRLTVAQACARHAGVDLAGVTDADQLRVRAEAAGIGPFGPGQPSFEEVASRVMVERVEPALAGGPPVMLYDFPAPLAALSRLREDDPSVAERFELYAGGIELANAFGELTDPEEQVRRLEQDQRRRGELGAEIYPLDRRFVEALREGMPPSAGIALGVDRLVMLLGGAAHIDQVVAFSPDEI